MTGGSGKPTTFIGRGRSSSQRQTAATTSTPCTIQMTIRMVCHEPNWVETTPGKSWFTIFRNYGPLQPWFDQTWRLNEFEPLG